MKNVFYTIFAISICLLLGKLTNYLFAGLPGSLYGMVIYATFLQLNWFSPKKVTSANQWFIKHMGVCLVPAGMGIIDHFRLIQEHGIALIFIICSSTFILLTIIGYLSERFLVTEGNNKTKPSTGSN